jgi:tripartite-type tricarboxylate transporter receptor subunit TctC
MSGFRFLLLLAALASFPALSQDWPSKPVKFVSPYPPGGSVDPLARLLGAKLGEILKQQFIVENRTGASGIIGTDYVAKSAPDGYTFVFIFDTHAVHQALNPKLPFDPVKDFAPVMIVGTAPMAITTAPGKPYKALADLVSAAKARPEAITIGNVGNGSIAHLTSILVMQAAGIKLAPVPFAGGGPLSTAAMGGHVELAMASVAAQKPHLQSGKLRALVQTGAKRSHTAPDVPTLAEEGVPGITAHAWWGILAPAGTPKPVIDKFSLALNDVLNLGDVRKTLTETLGMEITALSPQATQRWIVDEMARWTKVVKDNNIRAE